MSEVVLGRILSRNNCTDGVNAKPMMGVARKGVKGAGGGRTLNMKI